MKVISIILLFFSLSFLSLQLASSNDQIISKASAASSTFGVVTFDSSLPSSTDKSTVASKAIGAGFGWAREEYTYPVNDFAPYDAAYSKLHAKGLKILGLLTFTESGMGHSEWKAYVKSVVEHFPGVSAWEIMNEADNYLSPADYTTYLKEAYTIIKDRGSATVVLSGLTARKEVYPFWDGVKAAGGWGSFDAVGLHMFHNGDPAKDSYENGTMSQEVQKVINTVNKNGAKKIWVTELGFDSDKFGLENQANWLVQGLKIVHGFSEVDKIFVFRLFDHGNGLGLLTSKFGEKPAYGAVKDYISGGTVVSTPASTPAPTKPAPVVSVSSTPTPQQTTSASASATPTPSSSPAPKIQASREKSELRLDGEDIVIASGDQYRIIVVLKDGKGNLILDQKPSIILEGGQTELTDFVLVGNEWIAYVTSNELGERTANISLNGVDLGTLKMTFVSTSAIQSTISPVPSADVLVSPLPKIKFNLVWFYGVAGILVAGLSTSLFIIRRRRI